MAIDSETKRASVLHVGSFFPGRMPQPSEPDTGDLDDSNQRGFILHHYAGISAASLTISGDAARTYVIGWLLLPVN